jgi:hypothetical protein
MAHKSGCILLLAALAAAPAMALDDAEVREMQKICEEKRQEALAPIREQKALCEEKRQEALAPIREQKAQACIEQQLRKPDHCKRYYRTYGNVTPGPSGAPQQGYFYDLPECQAWLEAREALRVSRSRP